MNTKTEKRENLLLRATRKVLPKAADWLHLPLYCLTLLALDFGFQYFFLHLQVIAERDYLLLRLLGSVNRRDIRWFFGLFQTFFL